MMKFPRGRAAVAVVLVLGVGSLPALAGASPRSHARSSSHVVSGTVVSTDASRHTIVLAGHNTLSTLRVRSAAATHVALGAHVFAHASRLSDGSLRAQSMRVRGVQHRVNFRAVVVSTSATSLTLSGGGSVISLARVGRHAHDQGSIGSTPGVGSIVSVDAGLSAQGFDDLSTSVVGTTALISLEGTLGPVTTSSLSIVSEDGVTTLVGIPTSITLPTTIQTGQHAEIVASYSAGTFSLVTIAVDGLASLSSQGVSQAGDENQVEVEGLVVASSSTSITIQPGDQASPVVLVVPGTVDVSSATVGTYVHASAAMLNNVLTLTEIHVEDSSMTESSTTEVEGVVVSYASGVLVIQTEDSSVPVSITVPAGFDTTGVVAGARVHAVASIDATTGTLTLVRLHVQQSDGETLSGSLHVEGSVVGFTPATSVTAGSLVVQEGDGASTITISLPTTLVVTGVLLGVHVNVTASLQGGALTASAIEVTD